MSVKRNKDGSVSIKTGDSVTSIGKVVSTYVTREDRISNWTNWAQKCAKFVKVSPHTFRETEQFFLEQCDAETLSKDDRCMKSFQLNVILNHCKDKLIHKPAEFSFDMTDEEIEKWYIEDAAMRNEAMNSSPEHFGLNIHGYYLPHTERNDVFYEETYTEKQKLMRRNNPDFKQAIKDICFFFEETTGYWQCSGGGDSLMKRLIVFMGIGEEDIEKCSPRYLLYINTLREIGELPDSIEE